MGEGARPQLDLLLPGKSTLHVTTVDVTLIAIVVHVAANLCESLRHRENMFKAMVTGQKNALPTEPGHH